MNFESPESNKEKELSQEQRDILDNAGLENILSIKDLEDEIETFKDHPDYVEFLSDLLKNLKEL